MRSFVVVTVAFDFDLQSSQLDEKISYFDRFPIVVP